MTKIVNLFAISMGALFLILCGFMPKLAAIFQIMPPCVLGGAAVMMFASIIVSGIQLIGKDGITPRIATIVSVSLGLGYGLGSNAHILAKLPPFFRYVFGGSGVVPAALCALILNLIIRDNKN